MCHGSLYDPYGHHIGFVDNFYTKLGSAQMNLELEDGRTFQFNPGDLLRDRQGDWRIRKREESAFDSMRYMHWANCVMEEATKKKEIQNWVEKSGKKYPGKPAAGKAVDLDVLKKYSSEANNDFEKFLSAAASNNQSGTLLHLTALVADLKILENEINK